MQNIQPENQPDVTLGFEELTALALILSISNLGIHSTLQKQIKTNVREANSSYPGKFTFSVSQDY